VSGDALRRAHSQRFRRLGGQQFPLTDARVYGGDLALAAGHGDEQVFATVAAWEREQGVEPVDWRARGKAFRASREGNEKRLR
jgi:hypothetical protein